MMTSILRPPLRGHGEPRNYHFPDFDHQVLDNGLTVWSAPIKGSHVITAILLLDAGTAAEDEPQAGIAALTARLLVNSTLLRDAGEAIRQLDIKVDSEAGWDSVDVVFQSRPGRMAGCVAMLAEIVREPRFEEAEFEQVKAGRLADITKDRTDPAWLADELFLRHVFDADSPYRWLPVGTPKSVAGLTPSDIRAFHDRHWWPGGAHLVLAGAIEPDAVVQAAERHFSDWSRRGPAQRKLRSGPAGGRRVVLADAPGSTSSELRIGHLGIERSSSKYVPALVLGSLLGGASSSRLNRRLLELLGGTRGPSAGFEPGRAAGPFRVSAAVQAKATTMVLHNVLDELEHLQSAAPDAVELARVRDSLIGAFPSHFDTTAGVAAAIAQLAIYGLPDEYWQTYRQQLIELSAPQVLAAARELIHPDQLVFLVVGDAGAVRSPLEDAGLGPLELSSAN